MEDMKAYFWTTTLASALIYATGSAALYAASLTGQSLGNITPQMLRLASLLLLLNLAALPTSFLTAHLKTNILFLSSLAGNTAKIALGITLVYMGWDWVGATIGYAALQATNLAVTTAYSLKLARPPIRISVAHLLETLRAGVATWIPNTIALAGQWLAVIALYGVTTPSTTGKFYIAMAISNVVAFLALSIISLLLPVLSGLKDGRKRATSKLLETTLALVTPAAVFIIAHPTLPLSLLGPEYTTAATSLQILLLSLIPLAITGAVTNLLYAYGDYTKITAIGLAQNIPRIAAYTLLTPLAGSIGASTSYTLGALTGMAASIMYGRKRGYTANTRKIALTAAIPALLALAALPAHSWPATLAALTLSYPAYLALRVVERKDLEAILSSLA